MQMGIHELEKQLKQGKLSFASDQRMMKYLGVTPGSVTPFGLINDTEHHVHVFLDHNLLESKTISFHPCINTASIIVQWQDFIKFLDQTTNSYGFITLYDHHSAS
jgi:Ala-tRNA(Pro) deacylase